MNWTKFFFKRVTFELNSVHFLARWTRTELSSHFWRTVTSLLVTIYIIYCIRKPSDNFIGTFDLSAQNKKKWHWSISKISQCTLWPITNCNHLSCCTKKGFGKSFFSVYSTKYTIRYYLLVILNTVLDLRSGYTQWFYGSTRTKEFILSKLAFYCN